MRPLRLHISDRAVEVLGPSELLDSLRAAWSACQRPLLKACVTHRLDARPGAAGTYDILLDGTPVTHGVDPLDLLAVLEARLYEALVVWHGKYLLLHAACVCRPDGRALVLLGESDAGKSSLARAAVRRGLGYLSDELVVSDGVQLWGIPRTVQFSPVAVDDQPPAWLGEVDADAYRLRQPDGRLAYVPLWPTPDGAQVARPVAVEHVQLVRLMRTTRAGLEPAQQVQALAWLHESRYPGNPGLCDRLLGHHPPLALCWQQPEIALDWLLAV